MGALLFQEPSKTIPSWFADGGMERSLMRLVSCFVRPERLEAVRDALNSLHVIGGMTLTDVRGFGRQKGHVEHYRGDQYTIRFIPKVRIDVAVPVDAVDRVIEAVSAAGRTGQVGDGKIFVMDLESALRIRTGEQGAIAL